MALDSLPREVLHDILSCGALNRKDLWSCSLVSRNLSDAATYVLYSSIDLRIGADSHGHTWYVEKKHGNILLKALATNPTLGEKVRAISICFPRAPGEYLRDDYLAFGKEDGEQAARNMLLLTKAELTECALTRHILANITAHPQLAELNLRLGPESYPWAGKHTPLKRLQWEVPCDHREDHGTSNCWNTAARVLEIAGTMFPEIVELTISNDSRSYSDAAPHPLSSQSFEHRESVLLPHLKSFTYQGKVVDMERELMLEFIQKNQDTLTSLAIPTGYKTLDQRKMDHILQIVKAAPNLKSLTIPARSQQRWQSHTLPVWLDASANSAHGIEFFEMWNIGCSFSPAIGHFFAGWDSLRVLKIGAPLYEEDENDGRPHFDDVAPEILGFVKNLPRSIEELYIELDNGQLVCDEDEDFFDPIVELPLSIFKSLTRLHTLDINAWIANIDGSTGNIPEKAIFCRRRRPCEQDKDNQYKKAIWISRLECLYQEEYANLSNTTIEVEGAFEGKDADEPWLGGERSWVSQSSKHWVNGQYLLGVDLDPYDPAVRYNSDDDYDDEDD